MAFLHLDTHLTLINISMDNRVPIHFTWLPSGFDLISSTVSSYRILSSSFQQRNISRKRQRWLEKKKKTMLYKWNAHDAHRAFLDQNSANTDILCHNLNLSISPLALPAAVVVTVTKTMLWNSDFIELDKACFASRR